MGGTAAQNLNQNVLIWVRGKLGRQVDRGECWDLGELALKQAGAATSNDLGPVGDDDDYIWGDEETDFKQVKPGDILQIRDHSVTTTTESVYTFADGTEVSAESYATVGRPHHTAIVDQAINGKGAFKTLEQNVDPKGKVVQNLTLPTADQDPVVTTGKVMKKNPTSGKTELAKFKTTVTVTVTGTIKAYHPKKP